MKISRRLNTLTYSEYGSVLSQHQKYTDFNTLGLFRSIIENEKLNLTQKIDLRNLAAAVFGKTFEFLQLKDPATYFALTTLGEQLTVADEAQRWTNIRLSQQTILQDKKLRHRNFGTYSRHNCGYDDCPMKGVMLRQTDSTRAVRPMSFCADKNRHTIRLKAAARNRTASSSGSLFPVRLMMNRTHMTIQQLIATLKADLPQTDITLYPPASAHLMQQLEAALGVVLPADFREFYAFCNGFKSAEFLFHITPIEEVIHFKDYQPHQFLFAEYGACVDFWMVEIRPESSGYRILSQGQDGEMVFLTDSLALFIHRFLQGGVFGLLDWAAGLTD